MAARLDASALAKRAQEATGLTDFGDPLWREGFERLVDSLLAEARLNPRGVLAFQSRLASYLRQRLQVVDWRARHPEIERERIEGPLIILGLPRTGTTALSNLLAQDPDTRSLRIWEASAPTPPPCTETYQTDPRIAAQQQALDMMEALLPDLKAMHHDTATSTAENVDLLGMSFRANHFTGMAHLPSYERWWRSCEMEGAYRFHRDVLQLLQWRCPPRRWHLKNPGDVFFLDAVRSVYPGALFIWTHRDPARVLPSVCSLIATVRGLASDEVDRQAVGAEQLEAWSEGIARGLAWRQAHPDEACVDVHMRDVLADPLASVGRIYAAAGWPFTAEAESAMAAWLRENPPGRFGRHSPDPGDFGLRSELVHAQFREYMDRFDLFEEGLEA